MQRPPSLHLLNWLANWQGKLAQAMLGRKLPAGETVSPAGAAEQPAEDLDVIEKAAKTASEIESENQQILANRFIEEGDLQ